MVLQKATEDSQNNESINENVPLTVGFLPKHSKIEKSFLILFNLFDIN